MNKDGFYRKAMPLLEAAVAELRPQVGGVRFVLEGSVEGDIILGAFFEILRAETDLLQLIISFREVDGVDVMDAQVIWDHDSLCVEADEPEQGAAPATADNLEHLIAELPRLIGAFKAAVLRGRPADA